MPEAAQRLLKKALSQARRGNLFSTVSACAVLPSGQRGVRLGRSLVPG